MSYADATDVRALLPQRTFDGDSTPSIDQVILFCTARSSELDGLLAGTGITTPILEETSPVAFAWCKAAVSYGAAADAEAAAVAKARSDELEANRLSYLAKRWQTMTDALIAGDVTLTDAPTASAESGRTRTRGGFTGSTPPWTSRRDAYAPSYGASGREGAW